MLLDLFGEEPIVVERGAHSLEKSLKRRVVAQFATGGRFENRQAGVRVRLGKGGVEGDDAHPIAREELMNHQRELVATPRPVSLGLEASFVDVHDRRCAGRAFAAETDGPSRRRPSVRAGSAQGSRSSPRRRSADKPAAPVRSRPERGHSARTSASSGRWFTWRYAVGARSIGDAPPFAEAAAKVRPRSVRLRVWQTPASLCEFSAPF